MVDLVVEEQVQTSVERLTWQLVQEFLVKVIQVVLDEVEVLLHLILQVVEEELAELELQL
jgi:hypothetical protein